MKKKWRRATIGGADFQTSSDEMFNDCALPEHVMVNKDGSATEVEFKPDKNALKFLLGEDIDDDTFTSMTSERSESEAMPDDWEPAAVVEAIATGGLMKEAPRRRFSSINLALLPTILDDDEDVEASEEEEMIGKPICGKPETEEADSPQQQLFDQAAQVR